MGASGKRIIFKLSLKGDNYAILWSAELPYPHEIGAWFVDQLWQPVKDFFTGGFSFEEEDVEEPGKTESESDDMSYEEPGDPDEYSRDTEDACGDHNEGEPMFDEDDCDEYVYSGNPNSRGSARAPGGVSTTKDEVQTPDQVHEP